MYSTRESYVNKWGTNSTRADYHTGKAKVTVTFTPDQGYEYSGKKEVSFWTTNTVFPCNSDGSYTMEFDEVGIGHYSRPVLIGGVIAPFDCITELPDHSTFRVVADNMSFRRAALGHSDEVLYYSTKAWFTAEYDEVSSSNPMVVYISPCHRYGILGLRDDASPSVFDNEAGVFFVSPGEADVKYDNGKTVHFIVTGENTELSSFLKFVKSWPDRVKNMSDQEKVRYTARYIRTTYDYEYTYVVCDAFNMFQLGSGDCWAGNSLLFILCEEMGFEVHMRRANNDLMTGPGHKNCIVKINGADYISDATPGGSEGEDRVLMTYDEYMAKYGRE